MKFVAGRDRERLRLAYRTLDRGIVGGITTALAHGYIVQFPAWQQRHHEFSFGITLQIVGQRDPRPNFCLYAGYVFLDFACCCGFCRTLCRRAFQGRFVFQRLGLTFSGQAL